MRISYTTVPGNLSLSNGYGLAGYNMCVSLERLGHKVPFSDPDAKVEIAFNQPDYTEWTNSDAYHIQYTPWESTDLPKGWLENFNNNCDEVWTPSPVIADWYKDAGVVKPIYVYEHGVNHEYAPKRRKRTGKLKFLHMGEPAPRKGGQMAFDAFKEVFGDRDDVHLTIKAWGSSTVRDMKKGSILGPPSRRPNVSLITKDIPQFDLIQLMYAHHALVYPGWGEGFGLIPLEAMASGLPVICTESWAPYKRFLLPELSLSSRLVPSPWSQIHPGKMFQPSYEDLVNSYRYVDENYDKVAGRSFKNAFQIHKEYDWDHLTEGAFDRIVKRFS